MQFRILLLLFCHFRDITSALAQGVPLLLFAELASYPSSLRLNDTVLERSSLTRLRNILISLSVSGFLFLFILLFYLPCFFFFSSFVAFVILLCVCLIVLA